MYVVLFCVYFFRREIADQWSCVKTIFYTCNSSSWLLIYYRSGPPAKNFPRYAMIFVAFSDIRLSPLLQVGKYSKDHKIMHRRFRKFTTCDKCMSRLFSCCQSRSENQRVSKPWTSYAQHFFIYFLMTHYIFVYILMISYISLVTEVLE